MGTWDTIAAERSALADQLDGLTPEQWATPSLCSAWTVHDVAAHLVLPHVTSLPSFIAAIVAARGSFPKANVAMTAKVARRSSEELVADIRRYADGHFTPPGHGPTAPLTDIMIHGQDIRLPLGLAADRPVEAWTEVLGFLVSPKARRGFLSKPLPPVRLVATDADWTHGAGEEVRAPAAALALTLASRTARLDDLGGPGAPALAVWAGR